MKAKERTDFFNEMSNELCYGGYLDSRISRGELRVVLSRFFKEYAEQEKKALVKKHSDSRFLIWIISFLVGFTVGMVSMW